MTTKNDARNKTMVELFKAGYTYAELAAENELSLSRVRKILRAAGVADGEGGLFVRARLDQKSISDEKFSEFLGVFDRKVDELDRITVDDINFNTDPSLPGGPYRIMRGELEEHPTLWRSPIRFIRNLFKGA